ncbi:MAG: alkaline phosphatase family protein [Candidatus Cloacimonetes bacterium]|nr:alkaline phosphatase family protein [Candidatus Cloacimonadota bacterium]
MEENNLKKHNVVYPDYDNCIINLISTILRTYGVVPDYNSLKQIDIEDIKTRKNIVLMIFDGYGFNLLKRYSKSSSSFLAQHLVDKITSVYPSTTTSAITSIKTCKTPLEHGALGWTMFFKEYYKFIDFLPNWDSITGKVLDHSKYKTYDKMQFKNIFEMIHCSEPNVELYNVYAKYLANHPYSSAVCDPSRIISFRKTKQLFKRIERLIKKKSNNRKFIMTYSSNPDALEHKNGTNSKVVEDFIRIIDFEIEKLTKKLVGTNTLIIVTSDHGLIDIEKYHYTNEDKELYDCIFLPTIPEPRFLSFFVKKHKLDKFKEAIKKYEDKFLILSREELLKKELLGIGKMHYKTDDLLGDFVGIAISNHAMKSIAEQNGKWEKEFLAHHCGLTEDEMYVPLIMINV